MFDSLTQRFSGVFRGLRGRGRITEENVREAMREVRTALLEADVHLDVARAFCDEVYEKAIGQEVINTLKPDQVIIKIVPTTNSSASWVRSTRKFRSSPVPPPS
jgi:signal recognition particle subunit SRP54